MDGLFTFTLNELKYDKFGQLLSLDLESVISQGIVSLSHKQRLIEETLAHSYEIVLGGEAFGHCLVSCLHSFFVIFPLLFYFLNFMQNR